MWLHSMTKDEFLQRWRGATGKEPKGSGQQYKGICPAHDDKEASLSVRFENGKILLHCHAGCDTAAVIEAMGLKTGDLFEKPQNSEVQTAVYPYYDSNGQLIAEKVRKPGKKFTWRRPDGVGGYQYGLGGVQVPLYNLPAIKNSDYVFLVEGEKDVETMKRLCQPAVSGANGAAKWEDHYAQALQGKKVMIIPDNDQPGRAYAVKAATALKGTAKSVHIMNLAEIWPEIPEKADITDYINAKGQTGVAELMNYFDQVPEYISGHEVVTVDGGQNCPVVPAVPKKLVKSSEIEAQEKRWLLYPYFQEYKLGLIVGEAGSCKTQFTLKLAAFFTSGKLFWNENPLEERKPLKIIYLSGEDAVDDTLKPRFAAMGGNEENMFFLDNGTSYEPLTIYSPELIGFIEEVHPDIIMFDPLQGYYEKGANANDGVQIRKQAMYLTALAERYKFTPIGIMHPNKNDMMKAADRVSGSKEIVNVARTALYLGKDPENKERVNVAMSKWNGPIGDSFSFHLEKLGFDDRGHSIVGDLIYEGPCNKSADQIASGAIPRKRTAPAVDALTEMLQEMLKEGNGQVIVSEAKAAAEEMGFKYSSLQHAKQNLGLKFDRVEINRKKVNMWIEPQETIEHDTS